MKWIIRTDEPFRGHCQSFLTEDGFVAYTDRQTVEQYEAERGFKVRVIDDQEFDQMLAEHSKTLKTEPKEISEDDWYEALECLPPSRWHTHRGVNLFHVCEAITLNLVNWYARIDGRFYHFVDEAQTSSETLAAKVFEATKEAAQ
jgi:hypothetical protein